MKKIVITLSAVFSLISLVACDGIIHISDLKVESKGHFTQEQLNYLKSEDYTDTSPYNGNMSISKPEPVVFTWKSNYKKDIEFGIIDGCGRLSHEFDKPQYNYKVKGNRFEFYNPIFKTDEIGNTSCFLFFNNNSGESGIYFSEEVTVSGPRNVYVDGVENMRDIGGWGKFNDKGQYITYMKQGMLYRSGRFNEDKETDVKVSISENGLYEINNHLMIKTEIDLRKTSTNEVGGLTTKSVLGDDVNYIQLPMAFNGNNILTFKGKVSGDTYEYDNPAMIKRFFEILADKNNYPIDYHCSIGKDRTGCLSYLVEGLMGFEKEHMYRDYMFTNFADAGLCKITDITDRYGKTIDEYESGETLQEKVYNYLNDVIGVSKENLDNVINNLKA